MIEVECSRCGSAWQVEDDPAGTNVQCRKCGLIFKLPVPGAEDAAGETVQKLRAPEPRKIGAASQTIEVVQNALRYAAASSTGTSVGVFGSYPVSVCGKTGTAEVLGKDDYAWYASYAPQEPGTDGKQYVVVLMIEEGGHGGSTAAPAVRRIYDAIFDIESGDVVNSGPTD